MKKLLFIPMVLLALFSCTLGPQQDMSQEEFYKKHPPVETPAGFKAENALHFDTYQEAHKFLSALTTIDSKNAPKVNHTRPLGITFHIQFNYSHDIDRNSWGNRIMLYKNVRNIISYIAGLRPMQFYKQQQYQVNMAAHRKSFYVRVEGLVTVTIGFKNVGPLLSYHIDGRAFVNQSGRVY